MAVSTKEGGNLQLDQLLYAMACRSGISSPALLPSSSEASSGAAQCVVGMVRLVEVVLEPGKRACPPRVPTLCNASRWASRQRSCDPLRMVNRSSQGMTAWKLNAQLRFSIMHRDH